MQNSDPRLMDCKTTPQQTELHGKLTNVKIKAMNEKSFSLGGFSKGSTSHNTVVPFLLKTFPRRKKLPKVIKPMMI